MVDRPTTVASCPWMSLKLRTNERKDTVGAANAHRANHSAVITPMRHFAEVSV